MRAQPSFHVALCVCVCVPASYLRGAVPTRMSKLEKEFFDT